VEEGAGREERTDEEPSEVGQHRGTTAVDAETTMQPLTQQQQDQGETLEPHPRGLISQGDAKPFTLGHDSMAMTVPDWWNVSGHINQLSLDDVDTEATELNGCSSQLSSPEIGEEIVQPPGEAQLAPEEVRALEVVALEAVDTSPLPTGESLPADEEGRLQGEQPPGPSAPEWDLPSQPDEERPPEQASDHPEAADRASGRASVRAKSGVARKVKKLAGMLPAVKARASDAWSEVGLTVSSRQGNKKEKEKQVIYSHSASVTVVTGNVLKEDVLTCIDIARDVTVGSKGIRAEMFRVYPELQQYVFLQKAQVGDQVHVPPKMVNGSRLCFVMVADTRKDAVKEPVYLAALGAVAEQERARGGLEMAIVPPLVKDFTRHKRHWCAAVEPVVRRAGIVARLYKAD
jgi:hypothetical protein